MTQLFIQRLFSQHCKCFAPSSGSGGSRGGSGYSSSAQWHSSPPAYAAVAGGSRGAPAAGGNAAAGSSSAAVPLMDFAAFCTFCAAWEQRHVPAAVRYFFQILDLEGKGYLAPVSVAEAERKRGDECHAAVLWCDELAQTARLHHCPTRMQPNQLLNHIMLTVLFRAGRPLHLLPGSACPVGGGGAVCRWAQTLLAG